MPFEKIIFQVLPYLRRLNVVHGEILWRRGIGASTMKLTVENPDVTRVRNFNIVDNGSGYVRIVSARNFGDSTSRYSITNPSGDTMRYTWDAVGTDPEFGMDISIGDRIYISSTTAFNVANTGMLVVTGVGDDWFEGINSSGVVESNVVIGVNGGIQKHLDLFHQYGHAIGDMTTHFDVTNPVGTTMRYTYAGTGTNPSDWIKEYLFVGDKIVIHTDSGFADDANKGTFSITGIDTTDYEWFEVTNASGVVKAGAALLFDDALIRYPYHPVQSQWMKNTKVDVSGCTTIDEKTYRVLDWINNSMIDLDETYTSDEFGVGVIFPLPPVTEGDKVIALGEDESYGIMLSVVERIKYVDGFLVVETTGGTNILNGAVISDTYSGPVETIMQSALGAFFVENFVEIAFVQTGAASGISLESFNVHSSGKKLILDMMDLAKYTMVETYFKGLVPHKSEVNWGDIGAHTPGAYAETDMQTGDHGVLSELNVIIDTVVNDVTLDGVEAGARIMKEEIINVLAADPDFPEFILSDIPQSVNYIDWDDGVTSGRWYGGTELGDGDYYYREDYGARETTIIPHSAPVGDYTATVIYWVIPSYHTELSDRGSIIKYGRRASAARDIDVRDTVVAESLAQKYLDTNSHPEIRGVFSGRWNYGYMPNQTVRLYDPTRRIDKNVILDEIKIQYPSHTAAYVFDESRVSFQEWMERVDVSRKVSDYSYVKHTYKQVVSPRLTVGINETIRIVFTDASGDRSVLLDTSDAGVR